jgi:hypothetical protein
MTAYTRDDYTALLIVLEGSLSNRSIDMTDRRRDLIINALRITLGEQLPVFAEPDTLPLRGFAAR